MPEFRSKIWFVALATREPSNWLISRSRTVLDWLIFAHAPLGGGQIYEFSNFL